MNTQLDLNAVTPTQYAAIMEIAKRDAAQLRRDARAGFVAGLARFVRTAWGRLGTPARSAPRRARRDPRQLEIGVLRPRPVSGAQ